MRVNQISQKTHISHISSIKRNTDKAASFNQNAFIQEIGHINFTAKSFKRRYSAYKEDITDYVLLNSHYTEQGLERIIKRHCPHCDFREIERVFVGDDGIVSYVGDAEKVYSIKNTLTNGKQINLKKQTISVVFPENNTREEKLFFISRLLHEGTHALQAISSDRKTELDAINKLMQKCKSPTIAKRNLEITSKIYESLYAELLELSSKAISSQLPANEDNPKDLTASTACLKYYGEEIEEMAYEMLDGILNDYSYQIDRDFVLNYCENVCQCEIEAYSNEIDFLKSANYDYRKTLSQIKIEINQSIINAINSLR